MVTCSCLSEDQELQWTWELDAIERVITCTTGTVWPLSALTISGVGLGTPHWCFIVYSSTFARCNATLSSMRECDFQESTMPVVLATG